MLKRRAFLLFLAVSVFLIAGTIALPEQRQVLVFLAGMWHASEIVSEHTPSVVRINRAIDGDTIELQNGERVRYIGVNAPESVSVRRAGECFGKEAAVFNKNLVEGKVVRLEKDISDRDKYGRLLRFVYLEDGTLVNETLVREGYAFASAYPPDIAKQDIFLLVEKVAREEKRGLWSETTCHGKK